MLSFTPLAPFRCAPLPPVPQKLSEKFFRGKLIFQSRSVATVAGFPLTQPAGEKENRPGLPPSRAAGQTPARPGRQADRRFPLRPVPGEFSTAWRTGGEKPHVPCGEGAPDAEKDFGFPAVRYPTRAAFHSFRARGSSLRAPVAASRGEEKNVFPGQSPVFCAEVRTVCAETALPPTPPNKPPGAPNRKFS